MKRVILVIFVGFLAIVGAGCTKANLKNDNENSSTLTLNVNWDEAVANESTNKVIEDAIAKGYKVYAGIIKKCSIILGIIVAISGIYSYYKYRKI